MEIRSSLIYVPNVLLKFSSPKQAMATKTFHRIPDPSLHLSCRGSLLRCLSGDPTAVADQLPPCDRNVRRQSCFATPYVYGRYKEQLNLNFSSRGCNWSRNSSLRIHRRIHSKFPSASDDSQQSAIRNVEDDVDVWEADVVIVGAGVIGLFIADALLSSADPELAGVRVALIDSAAPCAGATGAGKNC